MSRAVRHSPPIASQRSAVAAVGVIARPGPVRLPTRLGLIFIMACLVAVTVGMLNLHNVGPATRADRAGLTTGLLSVTSLAATVTYLVILGALHLQPTGYDPVRHAVSDYGVGRYRALFTVALYLSSVGVLGLAFALVRGVGSPPLATRDLAYLLLIPIARIGMTLFPTVLEGQRISRVGLLHYACAVAAFTLTYLAISGMTPALRALDSSGWARTPLAWTASITGFALALVVITMLRPLRRVFGLCERIFLLCTNLWFAVAAVLLISRLG